MNFGWVREFSTGIISLNEIMENFRWVMALIYPLIPS